MIHFNLNGQLPFNYVLPVGEEQALDDWETMASGAGDNVNVKIGITVNGTGAIIYYDHWEDGLEDDISNPVQSTTEIWGDGILSNGAAPNVVSDLLSDGDYLTMENTIFANPRNTGTIAYDGKDKLGSTRQIVITKAAWPASIGTVQAMALDVPEVSLYGTYFEAPIGEDLTTVPAQMFEHTSLYITSSENGTTMNLDRDNNGSYETTVVLDEGEVYHQFGNVLSNARISADKPISVALVAGDISDANGWENRWMTLTSVANLGDDYICPVSSAGITAKVFIHNHNASSITINYQDTIGTGSFSVNANSVYSYEIPGTTGTRFTSSGGETFQAFLAYDANNTTTSGSSWDWGMSLMPVSLLKTAVSVGLGFGSNNGTVNGSPLWVTAPSATTLYIDYDGDITTGALTDPSDRKYDANLSVAAFQSVRLYDTVNSDNDQSKMRVYTIDGTLLAAAWGQDATVAASNSPYLDMGTIIQPFDFFVDTDDDGAGNCVDVDDDNDGIPDINEVCGVGATDFTCANNPSGSDPSDDDDNDGTPNYKDPDYCTLNVNGVCEDLDTDGDGIIDQYDLDSDADGCNDVLEVALSDDGDDGEIDNYTDTNYNGLHDGVETALGGTPLTLLDTDNDSALDFQDANRFPGTIAADDEATAELNTATDIDVLDNDHGCAFALDPSTVTNTGVLSPSNGTITGINSSTGEITYEPDLNFVGVDSFEYIVCDVASPVTCDTAMVVVTVTCLSPGPSGCIVAFDDEATTEDGVGVDIDVTDNDIVSGNTISFDSLAEVVAPTQGSISINSSTGVITYTPNPGYVGLDSFEYKVCTLGSTENATNTFTSTDVPITIPTSGTVVSTLTIPSEASGDIVDINLVNVDITHGYIGDVTLNLKSPTSTATMISGLCGSSQNLDLSFDDEGSTLTLCSNLTSGGTYKPYSDPLTTFDSENGDGTWTLEVIDAIAPDGGTINGWGLEVTYIDTIAGVCDVAKVIVTITEPNVTIANDDINQIPEDSIAIGNVLTNDYDDESDSQTVASALVDTDGDGLVDEALTLATSTTIYGTNDADVVVVAGDLTLNSDGTYTFDAVDGFTGMIPVDYTTIDNNTNPATDPARLTILVTSNALLTNDPPIAQNDVNTTEEDVTVGSNVLTPNDSDPDGDVIVVSSALVDTDGDGDADKSLTLGNATTVYGTDDDGATVVAGDLTLNSDGSYSFDPVPGFTGEIISNYTISDGALTDDATLTIKIVPVDGTNDVFASDDSNLSNKNINQTGNLLSNDTDPEGDGLAATAGTFALTNGGSLVIGSNGAYTYTPATDFVGTETYVYTVCDNASPQACDVATVYLTTLPFNTTRVTNDFSNTPFNTPIISDVLINDQDQESNTQTVTSLEVDSDGDDIPDATKTIGISTTVGGVDADGSPNANAGALTQNSNGSYIFTPTDGFVGKVTYNYTACDNGVPQVCKIAVVKIDVLPVFNTSNSTVIANSDAYTTEQGVTISSGQTLNDNDPEGGTLTTTGAMIDTNGDGVPNTALTLGLSTTVAGVDDFGNAVANAGNLTINANGTFTFVPEASFTGTVTAEYDIIDSDGDTDTAPIVINVIADEGNAIFATDDSNVTDAATPVSGLITENDLDPEDDLFAITGLTVDSDGDGLGDADRSGDVDGSTSITVGGTDSDGNAVVNAGTLVIDTDGSYTFTPASGFKGNVNVNYTVCDANLPAACDEATLEISVLDVLRDYGDAPVSYPVAWHRAMQDDNLNDVLDGSNDVWLGTKTSFDAATLTSSAADGDTFDDAMSFGTGVGDFPTVIFPFMSFDVDVVVNSTIANTVHYGMWIDWDDDGTYDNFYGGSQMTASPATVPVSVTVPGGYSGDIINVRLRVDDQALASSDFTGGKTNGEVEDFQSSAVLPIDLTVFQAVKEDCDVRLNWRTEKEDNFSHFVLERSSDGERFETITEVLGTGGSTSEEYEHFDRAALDDNYYRLKIVDLDGSFKYSKVIVIVNDCEDELKDIIVYPNPIGENDDLLKIRFYTSKSKNIQLMVTDIVSRSVKLLPVEAVEGWNTINLDVKNLPQGMYNFTFFSNGRTITKPAKVIKN